MDKYTKAIVDTILDNNTEIKLKRLNFENLLIKASQNRVLYIFCKKIIKKYKLSNVQIRIINNIIKKGEKNILATRHTIHLLQKILKKNNIDFLVVKTFKYLDYVTFDLDILVHYKNFQKTIDILQMNKILVKKHPNPSTQGIHQRNCFYPDCIKIDLHRKFFWLGINHIDENFAWQNTQIKKLYGTKCKVPSLETDFLLHNKQLVYERRYITLLDFLAIKYAIDEGLNWKKILQQINKYKWKKTFFYLLNYLNFINSKIYNKEMLDINKLSSYNIKPIPKNKILKLPLTFPMLEVINIFKEIYYDHKKIDYFGFAYYFFSTFRYKLTNKIPYYDHWYGFNKLYNKKYTRSEVIYK